MKMSRFDKVSCDCDVLEQNMLFRTTNNNFVNTNVIFQLNLNK